MFRHPSQCWISLWARPILCLSCTSGRRAKAKKLLIAMIKIIQVITLPAALLFGALLYMTVQHPQLVERSALGFLKAQVEAKVVERFPGLDPALAQQAPQQGMQAVATRIQTTRDALSQRIDNGLPALIATTVAEICTCGPANPDTENHRRLTEIAKIALKGHLERLDIARGQLVQIIKGNYNTVLLALRVDVTIFLATNLAAFIAIFLATLVRSRNRPLLIMPAVIMLVAVGISSASYLFQTNWFFTILFQDYWGYGYSFLVAGVFSLLLDVVLNRARVTNAIFSVLPNALIPAC